VTLCAGQFSFAGEIDDANRLFKDGKHNQQALDKVNGFLANNPKDAEARFLKGLIFTEQGRTSDAIKIYSALTEDYPELPEPYNNLAVIYASQGQYDKAKLALEMAMRTTPVMPLPTRILAISTPRWPARHMTEPCNWITATAPRKQSWP